MVGEKENNTQDQENFFVSRMKQKLTENDFIALRRAFGSPLAEASGSALFAFYKIYLGESKEEATYLAACTISYIMYYGEGSSTFANCLRRLEVSESRVKSLLNNKSVDKDGYFHAKYSRLVKYAVSNGCLPKITEVYYALTNWWNYRKTFIKEYNKKN